MRALAWHIDMNSIKIEDVVTYPYPIGIKKGEILVLDTRIVDHKKMVED
jgi:hypothetical protein